MPQTAATVALLGLTALVGCGGGAVGSNSDRDTAHLRVLGILYGRCMEAHGGAAPANQDQLVAFLAREPANWNKLAATPQELLTSPRDGQPLVVLYGAVVKDPADGGFPWIAHEKTGVDGKQMAINARGGVQLKDPEEVAKLFPPS